MNDLFFDLNGLNHNGGRGIGLSNDLSFLSNDLSFLLRQLLTKPIDLPPRLNPLQEGRVEIPAPVSAPNRRLSAARVTAAAASTRRARRRRRRGRRRRHKCRDRDPQHEEAALRDSGDSDEPDEHGL
jgi:hypothetical protein